MISPGGEIGRRTVFRWQHPKGCAGSNPVPGTNKATILAPLFFTTIRTWDHYTDKWALRKFFSKNFPESEKAQKNKQ
jgi:hypothetical protein